MSNELTTRRDIRSLIQSDQVRQQVALALPKFLTPERMLRVCLTSVNRNPKLLECTPESLLSSVMQAAQMGIEPDNRNGHLIPRWNGKKNCMEATFMPDYKGLVALVRRNENVADIYAEPVFDADHFKITKGLHRDLVHEVDVRSDRGAFLGAYAVLAYKDGTHSFEFMSKAEIDAIKNRSQSGQSGPWVTDYTEMAKKTVIKRLLKLADLSPEIAERVQTVIDQDDQVIPSREIEIKPANVAPKPAATALPAPAPEAAQAPAAEQQAENPTEETAQADDKPRRGRPRKTDKPADEQQETTVEAAPVIEAQVVENAEPHTAPKAIQTGEPPIFNHVRGALRAKGFTEKEFIALCAEFEWIPAPPDIEIATLDCFADDRSSAEHKLKLIFDDFAEVIEELESRKGGK